MRQNIVHTRIFVAAAAFFLSTCIFVVSVNGEELFKRFSLGGETLTSAPDDPKDPEPGVVTAKYGFKISKDFMPYMGTGLAYTYQADMNSGEMTNLKTGVAAQVGFNYLLGTKATLKFDYKYITVAPEQAQGDVRKPPQSLGIGLDIKF